MIIAMKTAISILSILLPLFLQAQSIVNPPVDHYRYFNFQEYAPEGVTLVKVADAMESYDEHGNRVYVVTFFVKEWGYTINLSLDQYGRSAPIGTQFFIERPRW